MTRYLIKEQTTVVQNIIATNFESLKIMFVIRICGITCFKLERAIVKIAHSVNV